MKRKSTFLILMLFSSIFVACDLLGSDTAENGSLENDPSKESTDQSDTIEDSDPSLDADKQAGIVGSARFYPWDTHDLYSTSHLTGYVDLIAGIEAFSLPASSFSFFNYYYLEAPFEVFVDAEGPVPIFLFSHLHYSDPPIFEGPVSYAGVALVDAVQGQMTDMYEGIPELEPSEYQDFYVPLDIDPLFTPAGLPEVASFSVQSSSTTVPFVAVSGTIQNTDLSVTALKINDHYLLIDLESSGAGQRTFTKVVDLVPGMNSIELLAVSTAGHTISSSLDVAFSSQSADSVQPDIYTTLTWDWPSSDMDLFVWHFAETSPGSSREAIWLAESRNADIPGAPDMLESSSFFGGGLIGHSNGGQVSFVYDEEPALLTINGDDPEGGYSLSLGNMGDVVFDLLGKVNSTESFWDGTGLGSFDLGTPTNATGFFSTGGFGFATMTDVTGVLEIVSNNGSLVTGSLTLQGPASRSIPETDFIVNFSDALLRTNSMGTVSYSNPNANLDIKESKAYGPEHFTLYDAPDGYYVFAVASISMKEPEHFPNSFLHTRAFVGAQIGETQYRFSPHWFETQHGDPLTRQNAPQSYWVRVFDLEIQNGTPKVLSPDFSIGLSGYPDLNGLR